MLEFKFVKINKRGGVQIRSGGDGKNFKKLISGGGTFIKPQRVIAFRVTHIFESKFGYSVTIFHSLTKNNMLFSLKSEKCI